MKNILLMTILVGTIACNGSGGAGPKVEVGPEFTYITHTLPSDILDHETLNPCGESEETKTVGNTIITCNFTKPAREEMTVTHWPSVNCDEVDTLDKLKTCIERTDISYDIADLEGLNNIYLAPGSDNGGWSVLSWLFGEYKGIVTTTDTSFTISGENPSNGKWEITLYSNGTHSSRYIDNADGNVLSGVIKNWWIEDTAIVLHTSDKLDDDDNSKVIGKNLVTLLGTRE